jgi:hypothetical protein
MSDSPKYPHTIANWPTEDRPIARETRETVLLRAALRNKAKQIALEVEGLKEVGEEEAEVLEVI